LKRAIANVFDWQPATLEVAAFDLSVDCPNQTTRAREHRRIITNAQLDAALLCARVSQQALN
jgi:hypothetical protein